MFGLGVMREVIVAGVVPYERETPIEILYAILKDDAPSLAGREGLTEDLDHVIRHCLEKSPTARFQSARDLAFVLEFTLRSQQASPQTPTPRRRILDAILDRKSTRLNSSHLGISYAVF